MNATKNTRYTIKNHPAGNTIGQCDLSAAEFEKYETAVQGGLISLLELIRIPANANAQMQIDQVSGNPTVYLA